MPRLIPETHPYSFPDEISLVENSEIIIQCTLDNTVFHERLEERDHAQNRSRPVNDTCRLSELGRLPYASQSL
jgi:hypothetical protein